LINWQNLVLYKLHADYSRAQLRIIADIAVRVYQLDSRAEQRDIE